MPGRLLGFGKSQSPARSASTDRDLLPTSRSNSPGAAALKLPQAVSMDHLKRHSLAGLGGLGKHDKKKDKEKSSGSASPATKPTIPKDSLEVSVESPPNVFYGKPEASSGVLFSGGLSVHVETASELHLTAMTMSLVARIVAKKPVAKECAACLNKDTELKKWTFLSEVKTVKRGKNAFPFSHLIPGHLPATTYGQLAHVEYFLEAHATTQQGHQLFVRRDIPIARSLPVPPEKNSLRVFPPTDLQVHLSLVPIIHPIGRFTAAFRLSNINVPPAPKRPELHTRWIIRKLTWKLEEEEKMISPACSKHAAKVGGEGRGKEHSESRVLARDDLFEGFKTDYHAGEIDCEFSIILPGPGGKRALCDVETGTGFKVTHSLTVELIIAEEWQSNVKADRWGATGQARVLRGQFGIQITERAGLGIAWDEEEPPLYEDMTQPPPPDYQHEFGLPPLSDQARQEMASRVREAAGLPPTILPASPPIYGVNSHIAAYEGPPLDEVIEDLSLDDHIRRPSPMRGHGSAEGGSLPTTTAGQAPDPAPGPSSHAESSSAAAQRNPVP